jgi:hypothetical protein
MIAANVAMIAASVAMIAANVAMIPANVAMIAASVAMIAASVAMIAAIVRTIHGSVGSSRPEARAMLRIVQPTSATWRPRRELRSMRAYATARSRLPIRVIASTSPRVRASQPGRSLIRRMNCRRDAGSHTPQQMPARVS